MHSDPPDRIESAKRTAGNSVLLQRNRAEPEASVKRSERPLSVARAAVRVRSGALSGARNARHGSWHWL